MANPLECSSFSKVETRFDSKPDLEDLVLQPPIQIKKVDEQLSIEFTDIKYEPMNHVENYQIGNEYDSKCVFCDTSFQQDGPLDGFTIIHKICFKMLHEKLNMANKKIREMELNNEKEMNAQSYQSVEIQTDFLEGQMSYDFSTTMSSVISSTKLTSKTLNEKRSYVLRPSTRISKKQSQTKSHSSIQNSTVKDTKFSENKKDFKDRTFNVNGGKKKDFKCDLCKFPFSKKTFLQRHISTVHEKKKDYKCKECNTCYAHKETLKSHILRVHLKIRPYQCGGCSKKFVRKTDLNKHVKNNH